MEEDKIVFPYGNNIGFQEGVLAQRKVNDLKRLQMMVRYATAKKHSAVVYRYFNYSSFDEIQLDESMLPNFKKEIMRFIGNYTIAKTDMIKILTDPADEQLALLPDFAGIFKGIWTGYLRTELEELVFEGLIRQAKVSQANYYHLAKEGGRYLDKLGYEHKHPESVVASFRHFDHREMIVNALLAWMRKMDISEKEISVVPGVCYKRFLYSVFEVGEYYLTGLYFLRLYSQKKNPSLNIFKQFFEYFMEIKEKKMPRKMILSKQARRKILRK